MDEYAFGNGTPGGLVRSTKTTYDTALGNIVDHPTSVQVLDGSQSQIAVTNYAYDEKE